MPKEARAKPKPGQKKTRSRKAANLAGKFKGRFAARVYATQLSAGFGCIYTL